MLINANVKSIHNIGQVHFMNSNPFALSIRHGVEGNLDYILLDTDKGIRLVNLLHKIGFQIRFAATAESTSEFVNSDKNDPTKTYVTWGEKKSIYEVRPIIFKEWEGKIQQITR